MKSQFPGFPNQALQFLRDLKKNNNREWFLAHKDIYETHVKGSMIEFLRVLAPHVEKFAPEIAVNPKTAIFRIYRDVRFSKDKSPYKTHIAAHLSPQTASGTSAGLYFHLDPREIFVGGGLYHPEPNALRAVRTKIASDYKTLQKIITGLKFKKLFGEMTGEKLTRVPKGFSCDHPAQELLKHKDFIAFRDLTPEDATKPEIVKITLESFEAMMPFLRYLNEALRATAARFF